MVRVTNAVASRATKKRILKKAKGFWGDRKNHIRQTRDALMNAMRFHYQHRKQRKSEFRQLWITRIGIAAKLHGISYNRLMFGLKKANCPLNRKSLAEMAIADPQAFGKIAETAKNALV
jgi:large subunit ribosomal protein L20